MSEDVAEPTGPSSAGAGREERLARTFLALADTLVKDYDVVELLDGLVHACVDLLGASQAGLLLNEPRGELHLMASSDETTRIVELFQRQSAAGGPCSEAARGGVEVTIEDLRAESRWPELVGSAADEGFHSFHAVPMRLRDHTVGALGLFTGPATSLSAADRQLTRALADFATIGILQQRSLHRSSLLTEQLQTALNTRVVIEQAKGMLAEHGGVGMEDAFQALRAYCLANDLKLSVVAASLVRRRIALDDLVAAPA